VLNGIDKVTDEVADKVTKVRRSDAPPLQQT